MTEREFVIDDSLGLDDVVYEKNGNVARITINRPEKLNAVRQQTIRELLNAFEAAEADDSVAVVVLTGKGERSFTAGGDITEFGESNPYNAFKELVPTLLKLAHVMRNMGKPIIGAVNGYAMGFGFEILLFCDLAIASENASFAITEMRVGSGGSYGATQWLARLVGEKRAREIIFMARRVEAEEAERIGLVNKVVPADKLYEEVDMWCQRLLEMSPQSLRIAKTSMNSGTDMLYSSFVHGMSIWAFLNGSEEWNEGMHAFLEKRDPDWDRFRGKR